MRAADLGPFKHVSHARRGPGPSTGAAALLLAVAVELEGAAVDAVAEPGRVRPVLEDVAQMAAAARAQHLGADHAVAHVALGLDGLVARRRVEARPARARLELRVGA